MSESNERYVVAVFKKDGRFAYLVEERNNKRVYEHWQDDVWQATKFNTKSEAEEEANKVGHDNRPRGSLMVSSVSVVQKQNFIVATE